MADAACLPRCPYSHRTCSLIGIGAIATGTFCIAALVTLVPGEPYWAWSPSLATGAWNLPNGFFGPLQHGLYALIALAASLVWLRRDECDICPSMGIFVVFLTATLAWHLFFIGLRSPWLGFLDVILLWSATGFMMMTFFVVRPVAGILVLPFWIWATMAALFNGSVVFSYS